ncbi:Phosphatidylinositolglycan class N-domain-containing protein [Gamsiella multidivaricata]|uniref:Phosphatidylinositolglycan class N-domain-containing protein n=1 Tax=Gamsiella multidivaricata TaxID=101098 RepID=UPI00221F992D|nr:Phosphatidylinositolglycan class N-domain-containing protein [Gamsiella multidivaricata]KAG0364781.1 Glycosyl phosphatidyl inositol anchor synthesis [Gamsiella multidivaricata]KAI7819904.1 Phosphatidylinositolglycan class N-domain-containing protein [Gamsiella multidivaricata]
MALLPSKLTSAWLLILGVLFHVTYICSIFDIYFTSPLVHGMDQHRVNQPAPAKRLVLFVADGLRADKLYQFHPDPETSELVTKAPFLRHIIENEGTWGVSHTRVPTESRPGHVAIIAGFYEDVSAVTKGWQMNPVNFDSVFNQSEHTWSFGSPDILPMFAHGASDPDRIDTIMYPAEHEDFGAGDASVLDTWVFEKFTQLFEQAATDAELRKKLHSDKIVFFLHLLGLDTNGHSHLPTSEFYINNIKIVDEGIKKVTEQLRDFYGDDGKTAYVFTADHGMGNRGAHGDGHPDNTRTPIVAWGAGIQGPNKINPQGHDEFSADWSLDGYSRNDVKQADIAPLMASLIGINYPVNSVGELPLPYLDASDSFRAASTFTNTLQILEQYHVKQEQKRRTEIFFKPFPGLTGEHSPEAVKAQVQALIDNGKYKEAEAECAVVRNLCLEGLRYLQTYDWLFLRSVVSAGYLGWIVFSLNFILRTFVSASDSRALGSTRTQRANRHVASPDENQLIDILAIVVFVVFAIVLIIKQSPALYYAYVAFPVYFWSRVLVDRNELLAAISKTTQDYGWIKTLGSVLGYIIALEILVYSYFNRAILSVCFLFLALWPVFLPGSIQRNNTVLMASWSLSCLGTSIFTLLPVEMGEDKALIIAGGLLLTVSGVFAVLIVPGATAGTDTEQQDGGKTAKSVMMFQTGLIAFSTIIVNDTVKSLAAHEGLPLLNQTLSWLILFITGSIPFVYGARSGQHYLLRMVIIYLSFAPIFILLSISYESIFYFFLSTTLLSWLMLERKIYSAREMQPLSDTLYSEKRTLAASSSFPSSSTGANGSNASQVVTIDYPTRGLGPKDARPAIFFLFFINVAFFGTGNVASLASFSLQSVFRLTTVFNPFFMGALLIVKILIPFFLVSSIFRVLGRSLDLPPFSLFLLGLATTDVMTLNFFYLVRDDGSWLEIGTSISHFCISSLMVLFTILLFALSDLLVGQVLVPVVGEGRRKKRS